jgi:hypothetical protein
VSWLMSWLVGYVAPAFIAIMTPLVIAAIKWVIVTFEMKVPKALLPTLAPIVGAVLEAALSAVSQASGLPGLPPGLSGVVLGAVGNWLREFVDQWRKHFQSSEGNSIAAM